MQKYKIFLNEQLLLVESLSAADKRENPLLITSPDELISLVKKMENSNASGEVLITSTIPADDLLAGTFKRVIAAGGLVLKKPDQMLFIFRYGYWDLPKGKIKKGEGLEAAAIREVSEETGLINLSIIGKVGVSYHIHKGRNRHILKETTWYEMQFDGDEEPVPQTEESITEVKWFAFDEIPGILNKTYRSLRELTAAYLKKKLE